MTDLEALLYVQMINNAEYFSEALECFTKGVIDTETYNKISQTYTQSTLAYYSEYLSNHECECKPDSTTACKTCVAANWIKDYKKEHYHDYPTK